MFFKSNHNFCDSTSLSLSLVHVQILQGNAWGHSGIRRHECRVLRQRQTMATWNQPELWRRVPNIRWVCTFHCSERVRGLSSPRHPWSKNRLYPWIEYTLVLWENCSKLRFPSRSCWVTFRNVHFSVGNKNDDPNSKVVETTDAQKFAEQMGINLFETSAKENINVEEVTRRFCCVWPQVCFCGLMCLRGDVSGTCPLCGADQLRVWIRQRFWMFCKNLLISLSRCAQQASSLYKRSLRGKSTAAKKNTSQWQFLKSNSDYHKDLTCGETARLPRCKGNL